MTNLIDKSMPTIRITSHTEFLDCESCGSYERGTLHIELPDGRVLDAKHDGHFGSGAWTGDSWVAYYWCLQALGVDLHINGEPLDEQSYREWAPSGEEWLEVNLYPQKREIVEFTLLTRPDPQSPDYPIPVSISWVKSNGEEEHLVADFEAGCTETSWDGETRSLFARVLQDRALLLEQRI